jgi:hypothetical protein
MPVGVGVNGITQVSNEFRNFALASFRVAQTLGEVFSYARILLRRYGWGSKFHDISYSRNMVCSRK